MKENKSKSLYIIVFCVVIVIIFFPYIKAEFLTIKYGKLFEKEFQQTGMISNVTYYKVIEYSKYETEVFYVDKNVAGYRICFSYENEEWIMSKWDCIWSTSGSADSFYWPYYR